jgi:hypothetical protein
MMENKIEVIKKQIDELNKKIATTDDKIEIYFHQRSITNLIEKMIELI